MEYVTLEDLHAQYNGTGDINQVIVTDAMSKKQYFADCEIIGWLLLDKQATGKNIELYHIYRRGTNQTGELINASGIFADDMLTGSDAVSEITTLLDELAMQHAQYMKHASPIV